MAFQNSPEILTVEVTDIARAGAGVARDETGRVVFIPYTAPGDRVRVRIVSSEKRYAQGELVEILQPSPIRQTPRCPVFGRCGGCQWQHLPYELQWKTKLRGVEHALSRVGVALPGAIEEMPAERIWEYRNRVQLRGDGEKLGFYAAGSHDVVPIERCDIARPEINASWPGIREQSGRFDRPYKVEVEVAESGEVRKSWNRGHAALGFRQIHDEQNEKLRAWVGSAITPGRPLFDLFGGSGNLSRPLAERQPEIQCVDLSVPSQRPAGLPETFHFHRSPVAAWIARQASDGRRWSAIVDPPREGLGADFATIEAAFERIGVDELVAVGCDPDAWARDVSRWVRKGWKLERVAVLDLFPQTPHVESLAILRAGRA